MSHIAAHNTKAALELFNRLYTEGKDLGALMDELACLTRDLLVIKTAPDSAVTMLSGVVSDSEVASLSKSISTGELIRMMEKIEETMSRFTRSASRRLDAELCIISLCQPELQLDAKSMNARLTRLEEQIKSGSFTVAPISAVSKPQIQEDEELPPMPSDEDAPPEEPIAEQTQDTPVGFWSELVAAIRQELRPPLSGFFTATANAPVTGILRGNTVVLRCSNEFTKQMVDKPDVLSLVGRKASAILNRPVSATAEDQSADGQDSGRMEQLMQFGRSHSDIVKIKDN